MPLQTAHAMLYCKRRSVSLPNSGVKAILLPHFQQHCYFFMLFFGDASLSSIFWVQQQAQLLYFFGNELLVPRLRYNHWKNMHVSWSKYASFVKRICMFREVNMHLSWSKYACFVKHICMFHEANMHLSWSECAC